MLSKYVDLKNDNEINKLIESAEAIRDGKLVIFPTETVYGLGANALNEQAVKNIFIAKGRAQDNPLIVHISNVQMIGNLVKNISEIEQKLVNTFFPGPLTIVFNKKPIVPDIITGGLDTVAIRMPSNTIARKLIELAQVPIAAPSANVSGRPSGTIIQDIIQELDGKVEYIIDGGQTDIGVESTVVRVVDNAVHILRPGKITVEDIENLGFKVVVEKQILGEYKEEEKVMSPGIKYKHYAPKTNCIMVYSKDNDKLIDKINELAQEKKVVILCKTSNVNRYTAQYKLDMGNTLEDVTKSIFTLLRKADTYDTDLILIEGVEKEGLGLAVMNRLLRACSHHYIEI